MKKHLQPLTPAALYARVSSDRQDVDLSVAAQLRALREYAKANGYYHQGGSASRPVLPPDRRRDPCPRLEKERDSRRFHCPNYSWRCSPSGSPRPVFRSGALSETETSIVID